MERPRIRRRISRDRRSICAPDVEHMRLVIILVLRLLLGGHTQHSAKLETQRKNTCSISLTSKLDMYRHDHSSAVAQAAGSETFGRQGEWCTVHTTSSLVSKIFNIYLPTLTRNRNNRNDSKNGGTFIMYFYLNDRFSRPLTSPPAYVFTFFAIEEMIASSTRKEGKFKG